MTEEKKEEVEARKWTEVHRKVGEEGEGAGEDKQQIPNVSPKTKKLKARGSQKLKQLEERRKEKQIVIKVEKENAKLKDAKVEALKELLRSRN